MPYRTIEVWTDAELSAVHALWRLATDRRREDWKRRLDRAVAWHLIHTQPDNATNRPWALHVFLLADQPETIHYAETLLHNCQTFTGGRIRSARGFCMTRRGRLSGFSHEPALASVQPGTVRPDRY
jgi:hypothetical protein